MLTYVQKIFVKAPVKTITLYWRRESCALFRSWFLHGRALSAQHVGQVGKKRRKMPPKKKAEAEGPGPLLGRFGTSLKCGIVGLPNVGKSTFFNVLTKASAPAENFPFCTIDPNEIAVPDSRYDFLCEHWKPPSCVPAYLHVVDIAGLVKGAHEGHGLGNAFLSNISACDAIFHCVRAFEDEDVTHVEGDINPVRDLDIISEELRLKDLEYLSGRLGQLEKTAVRGGDKKQKPEVDCLLKVQHCLQEERKDVRFGTWSSGEIEFLNKHLFLSAKPVIYLVNLSERDYMRKKNKWLAKIKEWVDARDPNAAIIPFSAGMELKAAGKYRQQGRNYIVEDGDIIFFKFNAGAGLTAAKKK